MKTTTSSEQGWSFLGVVAVMASAALGAILFSVLFSNATKGMTPPWYIASLMLLPTGIAVQVLLKLLDLKRPLKQLTRNEQRRLELLVDEKIRQVSIGLVFYISTAVASALLLIGGSSQPEILVWALPVIGGFKAISLVSIGFLIAEMKQVVNFQGRVEKREQDRLRRRKLRKRLSGSS